MLPTIHSKHQYVVGITLTVVGVFGVLGSLTGNLAPMIAALFAPQYIQAASGSNSAPTSVNAPGSSDKEVPNSATTPLGNTGNGIVNEAINGAIQGITAFIP